MADLIDNALSPTQLAVGSRSLVIGPDTKPTHDVSLSSPHWVGPLADNALTPKTQSASNRPADILIDSVSGNDTGAKAGVRGTSLPFATMAAGFAALQPGDRIKLTGTFTVNPHVVISAANVYVDGYGAKIFSTSDTILVQAADVTIKGLEIYGSGSGKAIGYDLPNGLITVQSPNCTIEDNYLHDYCGAAVRVIDNGSGCVITHNRFVNMTTGVDQFVTSQNVVGVEVTYNKFTNICGSNGNTTRAIRLGANGQPYQLSYPRVEGNEVINNTGTEFSGIGIELYGGALNNRSIPIRYASVSNNKVGGYTFGISLNGCVDSTTLNNFVTAGSFCGIELPNSQRCTCDGDVIDATQVPSVGSGFAMSNNSGDEGLASSHLIQNARIYGKMQQAIGAYAMEGTKVKGCYLRMDTTNIAINTVASNSIDVTDCVIDVKAGRHWVLATQFINQGGAGVIFCNNVLLYGGAPSQGHLFQLAGAAGVPIDHIIMSGNVTDAVNSPEPFVAFGGVVTTLIYANNYPLTTATVNGFPSTLPDTSSDVSKYTSGVFVPAADNAADNSAAIQAAINAAYAAGGGIVRLDPTRDYGISPGSINVLENVSLVKAADGEMARHFVSFGAGDPQISNVNTKGKINLLGGSSTGATDQATAYITCSGARSAIIGLSFYDPDQAQSLSAPIHKPFAVRLTGNGCTAQGLEFINTYLGLDCRNGNCIVRTLGGNPLLAGLRVDTCYDTTRISDCHFVDSWVRGTNLATWFATNSTAYLFCDNDEVFASKIFSYGYSIGLGLYSSGVSGRNTPGSYGMVSESGFDGCKIAVDDIWTQPVGMELIGVHFTPTGSDPAQSHGYYAHPNKGGITTLRGGTMWASPLVPVLISGGVVRILDVNFQDTQNCVTTYIVNDAPATLDICNCRFNSHGSSGTDIQLASSQSNGRVVLNLVGDNFTPVKISSNAPGVRASLNGGPIMDLGTHSVTTSGVIRSTGSDNAPTTGVGAELLYTSAAGFAQVYDRVAAAYGRLNLLGLLASSITLTADPHQAGVLWKDPTAGYAIKESQG